ncbi:hypothetical protein HYQ46_007778 [Verticillium longisporum]|nr:hypothetical protein HYQ46_007778 [Verticillium longisporum]
MSSKADRISDSWPLAALNACCTLSKDARPKKATLTALDRCGQMTDTLVMMPTVPSPPMKSCLRRRPPALVATLPPTWHEPLAPRSRGKM